MSLKECWKIQVGLFSRHYLLAAWEHVTLWALQCLWDCPWWEHHCLCFRPASCPKLVPANGTSVQLECSDPSLPRRQSCTGLVEVVCVDLHVNIRMLETGSLMPLATINHFFHDFPSGLFALRRSAAVYGLQGRDSGVRGSDRKAGNGNCQNSSQKNIGLICDYPRVKGNLRKSESTQSLRRD